MFIWMHCVREKRSLDYPKVKGQMTKVQLPVGWEAAGMCWKGLMGAIIQAYTAELYKTPSRRPNAGSVHFKA